MKIITNPTRALTAGYLKGTATWDTENKVNNLMVNGNAQFGSTYNISAQSVVADTSLGGSYVFEDTSFYETPWYSSVYIPINTANNYIYSVYAKSSGTVQSISYMGYRCYDKYKNFIDLHLCGGYGNTTLAAPLNNGDTTVTVNSTSGWGLNSWEKVLLIFPPDHADYYTPYTYSRIASTYSSIDGNVITIPAWSQGYYPTGTPICNSHYGGTYNYCLMGYTSVPFTWTKYSTICTGEGTSTGSVFRYGTKYITFLTLSNYAAGNGLRYGKICFGNLSTQDGYSYNKHVSNDKYNTVVCNGFSELC